MMIIITQNAVPSEGVSVDDQGVGVVRRHHGEGLLLIGQLSTGGHVNHRPMLALGLLYSG
jgi:hypothetical protein